MLIGKDNIKLKTVKGGSKSVSAFFIFQAKLI
jgi:hypothetical protein